MILVIYSFFKCSPEGIVSLLLEKETGRERERETPIQGEGIIGCLLYVPGSGVICSQTGDRTHSLSMWPDQNLTQNLLATDDVSTNSASLTRATLLLLVKKKSISVLAKTYHLLSPFIFNV